MKLKNLYYFLFVFFSSDLGIVLFSQIVPYYLVSQNKANNFIKIEKTNLHKDPDSYIAGENWLYRFYFLYYDSMFYKSESKIRIYVYGKFELT
jgi:hypothetical protein